jgi:hypothetical protein
VDCDWGKKNADLSNRFNVQGYPTVTFCDPDGKSIGELASHDPAGVAKQMLAVADKYSSKAASKQPVVSGKSIEEAAGAAKNAAKPVAIFFYDDSPASVSVTLALQDELLRETVGKFVMAKAEFIKGSEACTKYEVTRAPTILVVEATLDNKDNRVVKPLARITGSRSARELKRDLEDALPAAGAAPAANSTTSKGAPAPREPEEKLSDDDIERRFIQARVAVAVDLIKRGKKDKAIEVYEDIIKSYPKHVDTVAVRKLLEDARK